jgi:hypothetical protein
MIRGRLGQEGREKEDQGEEEEGREADQEDEGVGREEQEGGRPPALRPAACPPPALTRNSPPARPPSALTLPGATFLDALATSS